MEELKRLLMQADDEYLTGLSNKGMVKRAYKDLEQDAPEISWDGEEALVKWKDADCRIKAPLGSSVCSCPSRSMCRHRIAAMLCLKREMAKAPAPDEAKDGTKAEGNEEKQESPAPSGEASGRDGTLPPNGTSFSAALEQELLSVPAARLRKACGAREFRGFLAHIQAGEFPQIEEGSTVTVRFPWDRTVVKLLSPLAYSTCTCHSKELCGHKAMAVLAYQLRKKAVTPEQLAAVEDSRETWNLEETAQAAGSMREGIRLQLLTGLSRLSPEAEESMERLAVISHGAGLPRFESGFRSAADEYRLYFTRSAAFRENELMERLVLLYRDACRLERAKEPTELGALAGNFRDAYEQTPRLHLTGMGSSHFKSKNGYEGEKYYFLETDQRRWYTWVDARPTFYEGVRRRPPGSSEHAQAPWGLNCSREKMMELDFYLTRAKAAEDGRLSVSQETRSEIVGSRDLGREEIRSMVIWDYRELFLEPPGDSREPVLAGAVRCKKGVFDTVRQRFDMEIFDTGGRALHVAVRYSREERVTIQTLERLGSRLERREDAPMVFFGIPYLDEGRLCLYPVDFFEEEGLAPPVRDSGSGEIREEKAIGSGVFKEKTGGEAGGAPGARAVRAAEQCLRDIRGLLSDLFQSGLQSVQPELLEHMSVLENESGAPGLDLAKEELGVLGTALEEKRHRGALAAEPVLASWARLAEYVKLGMKKTELDLAAAHMLAADAAGESKGEKPYEAE